MKIVRAVIGWIETTMASSFVVGDIFRNRATELLENPEGSLPQGLKEELEELLDKPRPTVLTFSTARKLKRYIEDSGKTSPRRGEMKLKNGIKDLC